MMEWIKRIFYKTVVVERQVFKKPRKGELGIITIPGARDEDLRRFVDCWNILRKNPEKTQILFTSVKIKYVIVDKKTKIQK